MKKFVLPLAVFLLLGAGCMNSAPVPQPVPDADVPDVVVEKPVTAKKTFAYTVDPNYTLTFPEAWKGVTSVEDFGGYVGESGPPDFDVPGKVRTFSLGTSPLFVIIQIDKQYKGHKSIPKEDIFLGENATSLFYGGIVTEDSQEWSFLYDGSQKKYAEQMKYISIILESFKLK